MECQELKQQWRRGILRNVHLHGSITVMEWDIHPESVKVRPCIVIQDAYQL